MSNQILKEFGSRIREIRIMRKLTQEELANKSNLSLAFVNLIENNKRMVSLDTLIKILNSLDFSLSDFFKVYAVEDEELSKLIELLQYSEKKQEYIAMFIKILEYAEK